NSNLAGVEVLDLEDSRAISLSDNDTTNGSFQACEESVSCDEKSVLQNVVKRLDSLTHQFENHRTETFVVLNELVNIYENQKSPTATENLTKENRLLKEENKALQTELTKCKDTLTELNTKLTDNENDDEAVMSGEAGNNQTLVSKKTPTIDHEKKRRLKNTLRNTQDTKQNSLPICNQRNTIQPKKQQCDVALLGDFMIKHVDVRNLRHGTNKQVTVRTFSGCRTDEMAHYIKPTLALKPKQVIILVGTNDLKTKSPAEIIYNLN
ncbi:Hypothetical predicted protein, partial [Paramuricea clavata]